MQTGFTFTADESLSLASGPVPASDYRVSITECTFGPTSDKLGTTFNFKYTITEGPYANRVLYDNAAWTWDESHQKAVAFGHAKFSQILLSIGHQHFAGDTDELLGGEMIVGVGIREYTANDGTLKKANQVNKWEKVAEQSFAPAAPVAPPKPAMSVPKPTFGGGSQIPKPTFGRN